MTGRKWKNANLIFIPEIKYLENMYSHRRRCVAESYAEVILKPNNVYTTKSISEY